jgi:putative hydrolase of the HAD superfamily
MTAVLFDLDDTLLDYSGRVAECWAAACGRAGEVGVDAEALARAVHDTRAWFWADPERHARERVDMRRAWTTIVSMALERLGRPSELVARAVADDFAARRMRTAALFDDALPCLGGLRGAGVRLGLVTNGDAGMQREKLARHDLSRWFDAIVIEGELGVGKPDVAVFRHALGLLGVDAAAATMVGDDLERDVAGAERAGIAGVWLDRAGRGPTSTGSTSHGPTSGAAPARVVRTLAELVPGGRYSGSTGASDVDSSAAAAGRPTR